MRFVIYGVGAIGGTLAVKLTLSGFDVVGIARGAQLQAIQEGGLLLRTPSEEYRASFTCVSQPKEIEFTDDDVILLTMKTQDSQDALESLAKAGVCKQPIVCMQNGVANERLATRFFENVLGAMVMMPATFLNPGEVVAISELKHGIFDIGTYPRGITDHIAPICAALDASGFAAFAHDDVMRSKYGKMLINMANGIDIALGADSRHGKYTKMARAEARAVYKAADIAFDEAGSDNRHDNLMRVGNVPGLARVGSSAAQSLARGAGSVEVDYLNGEIVLLGRLHGVPTPVNAFFCDLSHRLVEKNAQPGSMTEAEVDVLFEKWGA